MAYVGKITDTAGTTGSIASTLYGTCTTAAGTADKVVTCADFDKLIPGVVIFVKFTNSNTSTGTITMNVNGTGKINMYRYGTTKPGNYTGASWMANSVVSFTYDGTYWIMNDWLGNDNNYDRTSIQMRIYAGTNGVFPYSIVAMDTNKRMQAMTTTGGDGTSKAFNSSQKFVYPPYIFYHAENSTKTNGQVITNNMLYEQMAAVNLCYSCNITTSAGFTQYMPVYIECTFDNDGYWSPTGITQTLTTGKYYILLGVMYNTSIYQVSLTAQHPVYKCTTNGSLSMINCAGSTTPWGSAISADKLTTARSISLGNDFQGSANFDGSGNITISGQNYACTVASGNKSNYPWHRIARITNVTGTYNDKDAIFAIRRTCDGGPFGIIKVSLRTNGSGAVVSATARWMYRYGFVVNDVYVARWGVTGDAVYADIFLKCPTYARTVVYQVFGGRSWVLINSSEVDNTTESDKKTSVEVYKDIATAATEIHNQAYTATAAASDAGNVNYANSSDSASKLLQASARPASADTSYQDGCLRTFLASAAMTTGDPGPDGNIIDLQWDNNGGYAKQIFVSHTATGGGDTLTRMKLRSQAGTVWKEWIPVAVFNETTPTTGRIVVTDGTDGGVKSANFTIDTEVTSGSNNLITSGAVYTAIDNLPEPMVFRGSLGTGGTIEALPEDGSATIGDTYKVIEDGTYASQVAKIGDTFICDTKTSSANTWVWIPSGDEPSGTVTSVATGAGLTGGTITTSGTIKAKLQSETKLGADAVTVTPGSITTKIYPVLTDKTNGNLAVHVPWTDHITTATTSGSGNAVTAISADANGALTVTKGTSFLPLSGGTMTGQLKTSFKSCVAVGSYQATSTTIPDLCEELRYSSGCMGSASIGTAYTKDGITIAAKWYNFLWIPHRSGGVNGGASGDNCSYGTLILSVMTGGTGAYLIRYTSAAIAELRNLYKDTLNTAGSTDTSSKIFLIGATSQAANPQTYSDNEVYATSGALTTKTVSVGGGSCTMQYNTTTQSLDFVFA